MDETDIVKGDVADKIAVFFFILDNLNDFF